MLNSAGLILSALKNYGKTETGATEVLMPRQFKNEEQGEPGIAILKIITGNQALSC